MKKPFKTVPGRYGNQPMSRDAQARKTQERSRPRDDGPRGDRPDRGKPFDKGAKGKFDKARDDRPSFDKPRSDRPNPPRVKPKFDKQGSASNPGSRPERHVHKQGFTTRPTLRINLGAIKANYDAMQALAPTAKMGVSLKANAYGLGAEQVGRTLYGAGCRTFFVATAGEGKILREAIGDNASIYILNGPAPQDLTLFFAFTLKPVINSLEQARIWTTEADRAKHAPFCALHIDTGMNRLGLSLDEAEALSKNQTLLGSLGPDLIMSHLACAPDANNPMNAQQLDKFRRISARFPVMPLSLANSAGIYLGKDYHFQLVRPGISLFGGQATKKAAAESTQPVVSLMAPVLQIRDVKAGETIGYNGAFRAETDLKIAVLGAGYADGVPVAASGYTGGKGANGKTSFVTLGKQRVPIVGRVSMDLTIVDITRLKNVPGLGDWAEFRGENLTVDANAIGSLDYELLVRLGDRCRRTYQKG